MSSILNVNILSVLWAFRFKSLLAGFMLNVLTHLVQILVGGDFNNNSKDERL